MAIGVVALKVAVVHPQHLSGTESELYVAFYLIFSHFAIAVGRKQTVACSHNGAVAVAFYRATFENEIKVIFEFVGKHTCRL